MALITDPTGDQRVTCLACADFGLAARVEVASCADFGLTVPEVVDEVAPPVEGAA